MNSRSKYFIYLWMAALFFCACSQSGNDAVAGCVDQPVRHVLFIGNSYTSFNNLPALVRDLACSGGFKIEVTAFTPGGYRFSQHAKDKRLLNLIRSRKWSFVVLQNQSQVPGWKPAEIMRRSTPHAVALARAIKANHPDTRLIYYVTWGKENGDAQNCNHHPKVCTFKGNTQALHKGYTLYKNATGGTLARVGSAWQAVVEDPDPPFDPAELWIADHSHPGLKGSYLAACTLFAALFNRSPSGLHYPQPLTGDDAAYLQGIAATTMNVR